MVVFEAFELAAPAATVLEAKHAISWSFPGRAASIPLSEFRDEGFRDTLSEFLEQASSEAFDKFAARGKKGGKLIVETRDSPSPALISDMLMSLLEAVGNPVEVQHTEKRVRDDVVLDPSELPWRRCSYWLAIRVAVRRLFADTFNDADNGLGRVHYKFLMCVLLAQLLRDSTGRLAAEKTLMLQAKLCRRLAKLESEKLATRGSLQSTYDSFFVSTAALFQTAVRDAKRRVATAWDDYKRKTRRHIPLLPRRAPDQALILQLPNSGKILPQLLAQRTAVPSQSRSFKLASLGEGTVSQVNDMAAQYMAMVDYEAEIRLKLKAVWLEADRRCTEMSRMLLRYMDLVGDSYRTDASLMSKYLLLLFELWVAMDQAATAACPLLKLYHPVFVPEALDVLCLVTMDDMVRLRDVQQYMAGRVADHQMADHASERGSIFHDPKSIHNFPTRFVYSTDDGKPMAALAERIDLQSDRASGAKEKELEMLTAEYVALTGAIASGVCRCTRQLDGSKSVKGCTRCWKWRCRKRLAVGIHEDYLPTSVPQRAAMVLEFAAPEYLAAYRLAAWKLRLLGTPRVPATTSKPALLLGQYDNLSQFWARPGRGVGSFTLASMKKAFLQTHYKALKLPKTADEVIFPFGPHFSYYDEAASVWARDLTNAPWFQHLLGSWLPRGVTDPYADDTARVQDEAFPPTSYEIAANASSCPPETSVHEFSAFQRAVSGRSRRWPVLLVELASTNLNFSSETTMALINHLALQAGPADANATPRREAHAWFGEPSFRARLHEQLGNRLTPLVANWREVFCMSVVLTLTLRLHHLGNRESRDMARELLLKVREITSDWIVQLRHEVRSTHDAEAARKAANYSFWAALLCRQTFSVYLEEGEGIPPPSRSDMRRFFRASIALQESLLVNLDALTPRLRGLFVRDMCMSYSMRGTIRTWAEQFHASLEDAINESWTDSGLPGKRAYYPWNFLPGKQHAWWLVTQSAGTQWQRPQNVHYHVLQGHLLVDGKPLGRLPLEMREDASIRELFGEQHLLTRPSSIPGMQYQLASAVNGHDLHMGFRDGRVVVRALFRNALLEHVPRTVFQGRGGGEAGTDLPSGLVDDCVHWLNLDSGLLEMRRKPHIWKARMGNWTLDVRKRTCIRNQQPGTAIKPAKPGSRLVEPRSEVGRQIAGVFADFEDVEKLTIFQPVLRGSLTVEMKRLEIRFSVNERHLLQCDQLAAEVDPDQDAGTLYGLASQVVVRSVVNPDRRSILVPFSSGFTWKKRGMHVEVKIANQGIYARFAIDTLLGRLDCTQEISLLHHKAALHALTSFPLPDTLTGRTGTEEAMHCLTMACSQPWEPLPDKAKDLLIGLRGIAPKRHYYPKGSKLYQNVEWDSDLTMTIQHEALATLADGILQQSRKLETFAAPAENQFVPDFEDVEMGHLSRRALIRRQLYERISSASDSATLADAAETIVYAPRDRGQAAKCPVYRLLMSLLTRPEELSPLAELPPLFRGEDLVGGYQYSPGGLNVQELLDADVIPIWGRVVQVCRAETPGALYVQLFTLGLLVMRRDANATHTKLVAWLAAIAKNAALRAVPQPRYSTFSQFRVFESPRAEDLAQRILQHQPDYEEYLTTLTTKRQRKGATHRPAFEDQQIVEAARLADLLVEKWPEAPLTLGELQTLTGVHDTPRINLDRAWTGLGLEMGRLERNHKLSCYLEHLQAAADFIPQRAVQPSRDVLPGRHARQPFGAASLLSPGRFRVPQLETKLSWKTYGASYRELNPKAGGGGLGVPLVSSLLQYVKSSLNFAMLPQELSVLSGIIDTFVNSRNPTRKQYGEDLKESFKALVQHRQITSPPSQPPSAEAIEAEMREATAAIASHTDTIIAVMTQGEEAAEWLAAGNLWPCFSRVCLLELLRDEKAEHLTPSMKGALVWLGVLLTKLQRLRRMREAWRGGDLRRLGEEDQHAGHSNWNPLERPEWLLLEIDNDLLIRAPQVDVAKTIVSPASKSNSVLQMNMGEGESLPLSRYPLPLSPLY